MAKRRRSTATLVRYAAPAPRAASPIVIRTAAPRASPRRRVRRRRSSVGGLLSNSNVDLAVGGALYGFAVKQGWVQKLPAVPLIGRTGTAAILLHFWAKRGGGAMVGKAAAAAAVLAGYQLGSTGAITGMDSMGDAAPYSDVDGWEAEDDA